MPEIHLHMQPSLVPGTFVSCCVMIIQWKVAMMKSLIFVLFLVSQVLLWNWPHCSDKYAWSRNQCIEVECECGNNI
jgi:hypothetical protein